jgi:ribosome assembly protein YihI (activator of Der GTPase)
MVSFCESAAGFCNDVGYQDEGYFDALVHMFEQALNVTRQLSAEDRDALIARLDRVRTISHNFGYGVGDDMDDLLVDYTST